MVGKVETEGSKTIGENLMETVKQDPRLILHSAVCKVTGFNMSQQ